VCGQPAWSESWRSVFLAMSGVLVVATVVFWVAGSGQRQWWAIYVEMPPAADPRPPLPPPQPAAAAAADTAGTAAAANEMTSEGEDGRAESMNDSGEQLDQRTSNDAMMSNDVRRLDSAPDRLASFMRQLQAQQQQQQQLQQQLPPKESII